MIVLTGVIVIMTIIVISVIIGVCLRYRGCYDDSYPYDYDFLYSPSRAAMMIAVIKVVIIIIVIIVVTSLAPLATQGIIIITILGQSSLSLIFLSCLI